MDAIVAVLFRRFGFPGCDASRHSSIAQNPDGGAAPGGPSGDSTKNAPMQHNFRARLEWTGRESGPARTYAAYSREYRVEIDGKPPLRGSAAKAFRGDESLHNPEDLLVAALSACHMLSYLAECTRHGVTVISYEDEALGTMEPIGGVMRFANVVLHPRVVVEGDLTVARSLHEKAHAACFIANSVNFPVLHEPNVTHDGG